MRTLTFMRTRTLTASPHIAGSEESRMLAELIYKQWMGFNFDNVNLFNYSVLLSYPNSSQPNVLKLMQADSEVLYTAHIDQEPPLTPGENDSNVAPPFNAYAGSGTAKVSQLFVYQFSRLLQHYTNNMCTMYIYTCMYICTYIVLTGPSCVCELWSY